jgi:hypothetical protein
MFCDMAEEECRECGAQISNPARHRSWHNEIERKIKNIDTEVRRVKSKY